MCLKFDSVVLDEGAPQRNALVALINEHAIPTVVFVRIPASYELSALSQKGTMKFPLLTTVS